MVPSHSRNVRHIRMYAHYDRDGPMIDVVIPCRNEEATIGPIVAAFRSCPAIGRVIVVKNRCTDQTGRKASEAGAFVTRYDQERGKGQAILHGMKHVRTTRVILCDGDLTGFTGQHADIMSRDYSDDGEPWYLVGIPDFTANVPWATPGVVWDLVAGQRQLPSWLVRSLPLHGYCTEVQVNMCAASEGLMLWQTRLKGVKGIPKPTKERIREMKEDGQWLTSQRTR